MDERIVPPNPEHPLHQASFYVEALKYMGGDGKVTRPGKEVVVDQLKRLLADASIDYTTADDLFDAFKYYDGSFRTMFPGREGVLAASGFLDGLLHGIAMMAGLVEGDYAKGEAIDDEPVYDDEAEEDRMLEDERQDGPR